MIVGQLLVKLGVVEARISAGKLYNPRPHLLWGRVRGSFSGVPVPIPIIRAASETLLEALNLTDAQAQNPCSVFSLELPCHDESHHFRALFVLREPLDAG